LTLDIIAAWLPRLGQAAALTLGLFAVVACLSATAGLAMALTERVGGRIYAAISWFFRGVPELIILLICYLGLPQIKIDLGPVGSAILGFTLIGMVYDYEVFRAALKAVPAGQYDAARALGLTNLQTIRKVVLPQVFRIALTPWMTYATGALKRMSIASAIAVSEIMHVTKQAIAVTDMPFTFIFFAFALYAGVSSLLMIGDLVLNRRLDYLRRAARA